MQIKEPFRRLVVVSNRLPFNVIEKEGRLELQESVGGLVSGISAYLESLKSTSFGESEYIWIGWPGISVNGKDKREELIKKLSEFNAYPVFISETTMNNFYHGFCNRVLWPLFHYFPSYVIYDADYWLHYKKVNEIFRDKIMEVIKPGDVVWIHDYHLMLLPKLLREKIGDLLIGFFLHIPFPSFEVFRLLPTEWRKEILLGILGADLIGFHTYEYTQYFLTSVLRILGYENRLGTINTGERIVKVDTFPMGIHFRKFHNAPNSEEVKQITERLKKTVKNLKVVLSIDRLDYTKGIINRVEGYELFLEKNPEWHERIVLILVVVPSRVGVEHYQRTKKQIDELVGKVNGRFSRVNWTPILYQSRYLPFHELVAYYSISDVALITPLRDGMNLIAKEYISTRTDKKGVLILSEMAGASKELVEAIIINPNNREEIASALKAALEMPEEEQMRRIQIMQRRLSRYDVMRWANEFIQNLISTKEEQKRLEAKLLDKQKLIMDFKKANKRLIFLDYDGTLVPYFAAPKLARPDQYLIKILRALSENEIVLISGRDRNTLQNWFAEVNITLVAEHGIWIKERGSEWRMIKPLMNDWKPKILPILEIYTDRLPGSFIEEKEFSLAWHYREADPEHSSIIAKELIDHLVNFTANIDVQVVEGNKVIEIKNSGVNKGTIGLYYISKDNFDFICAIGDDLTDEDLFRVLPETAYSIRVGMIQSHARYNLHSYREVRELLEELADTAR